MVYLLHFHAPISTEHTAQHYLGYCADGELDNRVAKHRAGTGARFCAVARERNITFEVARTWPFGDRHLERKLKMRKASPRICPICMQHNKKEDS